MAEPPVQIGIPESAYLELKRARSGDEGEAIGLSGEEIAVIYQEDVSARAHLLDWSGAEPADSGAGGRALELPGLYAKEGRKRRTGGIDGDI